MFDGPLVVLDTTVLSNFASTDSIGWLVKQIERPAVVPAVRNELDVGLAAGHRYLEPASDEIGERIALVEPVTGDEPRRFRERLDPGEAESVIAALENDGILATDDLAARTIASDNGIRVTGSVGLLVSGIEQEALDVETANTWFETWRDERGYYAPVERISGDLDQ